MAYLSFAELVGRVGEDFYERFDRADFERALDDASSEADTYIEAIYGTTPLEEVPAALKMHVSRAAVYHLLSAKGFSPQGDDQIVVDNYTRALDFYKAVQKRQQALPQPPTSPTRQRAVVVANPIKRGW